MGLKSEHLDISIFNTSNGGFDLSHTGVRIRHIPSGIIAECASERSDHRNKQKAFQELELKVAEHYAQQPAAVEPVVIDLTPSWAGVLPMLLTAIEFGAPEGKRIARDELARMARAADLWNAQAHIKAKE